MNNDKILNIVITGANGFIGDYLTKYFSSKGHQVYALVHHLYKQAPKNVKYRAFDLHSFGSDVIPDNTDIVVHAAYIPYIKSITNKNINQIASIRLYNIAKRKKVSKFIFLSSLSASKHAISEYGKSKFKISKAINKETDLILKPGLVIGNGGLYNRIETLIKNSLFVPLIGGGNQQIQYILIDNLAKLIDNSILYNITGEYNVAYKTPIKMKDLYLHITKSIDKKIILLPFPYLFADIAFGLINILKLNIGINKDNYLGLKNMKTVNICNSEDIFKVKLKPINKNWSTTN